MRRINREVASRKFSQSDQLFNLSSFRGERQQECKKWNDWAGEHAKLLKTKANRVSKLSFVLFDQGEFFLGVFGVQGVGCFRDFIFGAGEHPVTVFERGFWAQPDGADRS